MGTIALVKCSDVDVKESWWLILDFAICLTSATIVVLAPQKTGLPWFTSQMRAWSQSSSHPKNRHRAGDIKAFASEKAKPLTSVEYKTQQSFVGWWYHLLRACSFRWSYSYWSWMTERHSKYPKVGTWWIDDRCRVSQGLFIFPKSIPFAYLLHTQYTLQVAHICSY